MGCEHSSQISQNGVFPTTKEPEITRETLRRYIDNEKAVRQAERDNPQLLSELEMKSDALEKIARNLERLQKKCADVDAMVEKERKDVDQLESPDLKTYLLEQGTLEARLSKEREEYMEALQQQEIARQELDAAVGQQKQLADEVQQLRTKSQQLRDLLTQQDTLLADIFGGEYGSELENRLEQQLDTMHEQKARITEASIRWRQAELMMEYACRQLAVAVQKWRDLSDTPDKDKEVRYTIAAETRDNLVAAIQNIEGCQRYLSNIQFPYCTEEEVHTLARAAGYVFTDMKTAERREHALSCYDVTYKRSAALLQWLDQVLETTIRKDLSEITLLVKNSSQALKQERARLIREKVREICGHEALSELEDEAVEDDGMEDEEVNRIMAQRVSEVEIVKAGNMGDGVRAEAPPRLSQEEMAPPPSSEMIFGEKYQQFKADLTAMTDQHEQDLNQFIDGQNRQAAKMQHDLQSKLNARRKNRAMKILEEKQKQELTSI